MVRTSGGIRISAGKSSKKGGGGGNVGGNSSRSTPSTPSGKSGSSSKGSNRLPPIPHCEAPSWQKPITNFFNSDAGPSKINASEVLHEDCKAGHSKEKDSADVRIDTEAVERTKDIDNGSDDGQLPEKRRKQEEMDDANVSKNVSSELSEDNAMDVAENETGKKTKNIKNSDEAQLSEKRKHKKTNGDANIGGDSKISTSELSENAMEVTKNEEVADINEKQSTDTTNTEAEEKAKGKIEKGCSESAKSTISDGLSLEKQEENEDKGKENIDSNSSN